MTQTHPLPPTSPSSLSPPSSFPPHLPHPPSSSSSARPPTTPNTAVVGRTATADARTDEPMYDPDAVGDEPPVGRAEFVRLAVQALRDCGFTSVPCCSFPRPLAAPPLLSASQEACRANPLPPSPPPNSRAPSSATRPARSSASRASSSTSRPSTTCARRSAAAGGRRPSACSARSALLAGRLTRCVLRLCPRVALRAGRSRSSCRASRLPLARDDDDDESDRPLSPIPPPRPSGIKKGALPDRRAEVPRAARDGPDQARARCAPGRPRAARARPRARPPAVVVRAPPLQLFPLAHRH